MLHSDRLGPFKQSDRNIRAPKRAKIFFKEKDKKSDKPKMNRALDKLKFACVKVPFQSFKTLPQGEYIINHFSIEQTAHGKRVRVDMDDCFLFLPERFARVTTEAEINELNSSPKVMIYSGKDPEDQNRLVLDFQPINYMATQSNN